MYDHIRRSQFPAHPSLPPIILHPAIVIQAKQRRQRVKDLARVRQVAFESVDTEGRVGKVDEVEVEDGVAGGEELGDDVTAGFAAAGERKGLDVERGGRWEGNSRSTCEDDSDHFCSSIVLVLGFLIIWPSQRPQQPCCSGSMTGYICHPRESGGPDRSLTDGLFSAQICRALLFLQRFTFHIDFCDYSSSCSPLIGVISCALNER